MTANPVRLTLFPPDDDPSREYFCKLGDIAAVMLQSRLHRGFQMAALAVWAEPAILLDQIAIAYDKHGTPFCYVTWALVSDDVLNRLRADHRAMLHISEWNEGDNLWIVDFGCRQGHTALAARFLAKSVFNQHIAASYRRADRVRALRRGPVAALTG